MRELHVIALSEDGRCVLLATSRDAKNGGFRVALDDRLAAALRGDLARPGEVRPRDSTLTPREIQARLRAGESSEQIAAAAGVAVARVERFSGPVLSERSRMIDNARAAVLIRGRRGPSAVALGEAVDEQLAQTASLRADSIAWSTRREEVGSWLVEVSWFARGRTRLGRWRYDPVGLSVQALDPASAALAHREALPAQQVRRTIAAGKAAGKSATDRKSHTAGKSATAGKSNTAASPAAKAPSRKAPSRKAVPPRAAAPRAAAPGAAAARAVAPRAAAARPSAPKVGAIRQPATRAPARPATAAVGSRPAAARPAVSSPAVSSPAVSRPAVSRPAVNSPAVSRPAAAVSDGPELPTGTFTVRSRTASSQPSTRTPTGPAVPLVPAAAGPPLRPIAAVPYAPREDAAAPAAQVPAEAPVDMTAEQVAEVSLVGEEPATVLRMVPPHPSGQARSASRGRASVPAWADVLLGTAARSSEPRDKPGTPD